MTLEQIIKQRLDEATKALNQSKKTQFCEEELAALPENELTTLVENIEQLDELSQSTLKAYVAKKSKKVDDLTDHAAKLGDKEFDKHADGDTTGAAKTGEFRAKALDAADKGKEKIVKVKTKLSEESLDEMSIEEVEALVEDIEQLDELSKTLLNNYVKKATSSKGGLTNSMKLHDKKFNSFANRQRLNSDFPNSPEQRENDEILRAKTNYHDEKADIADKKLMNRTKMIVKARNKLSEESVSAQVASLLEAEGLSEEFKLQAVTIFEAAVTDRVLQIQEELKTEFDSQLAEAKKELDNDIDGFLSEAVQKWRSENEVAIASNFKSQLAESFMDGVMALIAEHNIEVPEGKEDALAVALAEVEKLNEAETKHASEIGALQEKLNELESQIVLESFKEKMTQTEFDRFTQLTESIQFDTAEQYAKQLTIVLENFGATKTEVKPVITEEVAPTTTLITETFSNVNKYAEYLTKGAAKR